MVHKVKTYNMLHGLWNINVVYWVTNGCNYCHTHNAISWSDNDYLASCTQHAHIENTFSLEIPCVFVFLFSQTDLPWPNKTCFFQLLIQSDKIHQNWQQYCMWCSTYLLITRSVQGPFLQILCLQNFPILNPFEVNLNEAKSIHTK